jgi:hypothetical protein
METPCRMDVEESAKLPLRPSSTDTQNGFQSEQELESRGNIQKFKSKKNQKRCRENCENRFFIVCIERLLMYHLSPDTGYRSGDSLAGHDMDCVW